MEKRGMGRVPHALRRCSRYSLEDTREAGLSPLPSTRARLLSEVLQKRRGRFHRRTHHICEGLRGAVDTPGVRPWGANRLAAQSGTQMLQSAFDIGDRHNAITLGL